MAFVDSVNGNLADELGTAGGRTTVPATFFLAEGTAGGIQQPATDGVRGSARFGFAVARP